MKTALISKIDELVRSTEPAEAIANCGYSLEEMLAALRANDVRRNQLYKIHALKGFLERSFSVAVDYSRRSFVEFGDRESLTNLSVAAQKSGRSDLILESIGCLESISPATDDVYLATKYDMLAASYGRLSDMAKSFEYGKLALETKDRLWFQPSPMLVMADTNQWEPQPFRHSHPRENVIAYSLFGSKPRYTFFAVENAKAAKYIYPSWICRFYVDSSVPHDTLSQLKQLGAEVIDMPKHDARKNTGLFWRFLVASDPNVRFFLVRDVDALVNVKECVAVGEWIESGKPFHVMRDYFTHTELVLAGMWGGRGGVIKNMAQAIEHYHSRTSKIVVNRHNQDQSFLREIVWGHIRDKSLAHDDCFQFGDCVHRFSRIQILPPHLHIGQDMSIFLRSKL